VVTTARRSNADSGKARRDVVIIFLAWEQLTRTGAYVQLGKMRFHTEFNLKSEIATGEGRAGKLVVVAM